MVYYIVDSCHNYTQNGGAEGWMYLKEVQGESIPKNSINHNANGFTRQEYFTTYDEAKAFFQSNFMAYLREKNQYIDTHDMVINDKYIVNN